MKRYLVVVMMLVGACGGDDGEAAVDGAVVDAPVVDARAVDAAVPDAGGPLRCLGEAPAATAPDPMTVEGQVLAIVDYDVTPVEGATVEVRRRGDGGLITSVTTNAKGRFSTSVATGGAALDAWFAVTAAGRLPTNAYPAEPLVGGESAFLLVADAAEFAAWYADAGETHAAGMRTVIVSVKDCDNDSPGGVTLVAAPAPAGLVYYDTEAQQWDPALAAATNGFVLLADSAAAVTVTPSIGAVALPARAVTPAADALTLMLATPRVPAP